MPCVIKLSSFHNGESYVLHDEAHYTFWMNLIERINEFHDIRLSNYRKHNSNESSTASIHIHNLMKLWDLLELFHREYLYFGPDQLDSNEQPLTEQQFKWVLERSKHHDPFVMTSWGHEYWGFLSGRKQVHEYYVMHWLIINDWQMIVVDDRLLINDWLLTVHDNFAYDGCFWLCLYYSMF